MRTWAALLLGGALALSGCRKETPPCALWDCAGACVDVRVDAAHCGACGSACPAGQVCSGGACALACEAPLTACAAGGALACAALRTDAANCGACGVSCPSGQVCSDGACAPACAPALTACGRGEGAWCADLEGDRLNCGACGRACAAGWACASGTCVESCGLRARCDGACVDLWTDAGHCGACGHACGAGSICEGASCRDACEAAGLDRCGEACVDLAADAANCGACGHGCGAAGLCARGACVAPACAGALGLPASPDLLDAVASRALLAADVDGDAVPDLLLAASGRIVLLRGLAAGGYAPAEDAAPVDGTPMAAADLDGDGDRDLLVIAGSFATEWSNDGAGRFTAGRRWPDYADRALAADLDGDGRLDVATSSGGIVSVSLTGSAAPPRRITVGYSSLVALRAGDVDGDGRPDLVAAQAYGPAVVLRNQGDGTFATGAPIDTGLDLAGLDLADADGDGDLDAVQLGRVRAPPYEYAVGVLRNDGGTLAPDGTTPFPYTSFLYAFLVADLDADGFPDAVTGEGQAYRIFLNAGDGTFAPPVLAVSGGARSLAAVDADRDGRTDLVAASATIAAVETRRQLAGGGWEGPEVLPFAADQALVADLDGDGRGDLVTVVAAQEYEGRPLGTLEVRLSRPPGFAAATTATGFGWSGVLAGDLDLDGAVDLVVLRGDVPGVLLNRGGGVFADEVPVMGMKGRCLLGDVTGDGVLDLVGRDTWASALLVAAGQGNGGFAPPAQTPNDYGSGAALALADVDGDGRADAAHFAYAYPGELVVVRPGRADGTFGPGWERRVQPGATSTTAIDLAAGDLDGDGRAEVAAALYWPAPGPEYGYEGGVALLRGGADGPGAPELRVSAGVPRVVAIGDLSGAGRRDVVVSDGASLTVLAPGDGGLVARGRWAVPGVPGAPALGDLDGDLVGDVVVPARDRTLLYRGACRAR